MQNSDSINPGPFNGNNWPDTYGTSIFEGATAISRPSHSNQYYLIYQNINYLGPILGYPSLHLRYSLIDMTRDSGKGGIIPGKRLRSIVNDTLEQGSISACKHANGRDWWVVEKSILKNKYYKILITPDSMYVSDQSIGMAFHMVNYVNWASFSPDGSKYAFLVSDFNGTDSIEVMDFDRCTGEFSNPISWKLPNTYGDGCIFSPNSRFLYVIQQENLYQYDMSASNISNSLIKVDTFDGAGSWFAFPALAPDGKIYVGAWNAAKELNVINNPDSLGKACNFSQHSFSLPFYNFCTPYYPNYDLGELKGSHCDSLTEIGRLGGFKFKMSIFPNPTTSWVNIEYESTQNLQCGIYEITGKLITHFMLYPYFKSRMFDMSGLNEGIYLLKVMNKKGVSSDYKIIKINSSINTRNRW